MEEGVVYSVYDNGTAVVTRAAALEACRHEGLAVTRRNLYPIPTNAMSEMLARRTPFASMLMLLRRRCRLQRYVPRAQAFFVMSRGENINISARALPYTTTKNATVGVRGQPSGASATFSTKRFSRL